MCTKTLPELSPQHNIIYDNSVTTCKELQNKTGTGQTDVLKFTHSI